MALAVARHRFTLEDYDRMAAAGILAEDSRVELINGEIVDMAPLGWRHIAQHARLTALFNRRLGDRAIVWPQGALRIRPDSVPQPDLIVLRPRADEYRDGGPRPEDVLLVVEISDTSLSFDRTEKMRLYARAGVPEFWVVDIEGYALEVYRDPADDGYRDARRLTDGEITLAAFPGLSFSVPGIVR
jgi:Uma2 family endonuclease